MCSDKKQQQKKQNLIYLTYEFHLKKLRIYFSIKNNILWWKKKYKSNI